MAIQSQMFSYSDRMCPFSEMETVKVEVTGGGTEFKDQKTDVNRLANAARNE